MASKTFRRDLTDDAVTAVQKELTDGDTVVLPFYTLYRRMQAKHGKVVLKQVLDEYSIDYAHAKSVWASVMSTWKSQWLHANSEAIAGDSLAPFEALLASTEIQESDRFSFSTALYRLISAEQRQTLDRMAKTGVLPPAKTAGLKRKKRAGAHSMRDVCDLLRYTLEPWDSIVETARHDEPECKKLRAEVASLFRSMQQLTERHQAEEDARNQAVSSLKSETAASDVTGGTASSEAITQPLHTFSDADDEGGVGVPEVSQDYGVGALVAGTSTKKKKVTKKTVVKKTGGTESGEDTSVAKKKKKKKKKMGVQQKTSALLPSSSPPTSEIDEEASGSDGGSGSDA